LGKYQIASKLKDKQEGLNSKPLSDDQVVLAFNWGLLVVPLMLHQG